ncbi:MAG: aspartate/glutamate racemase family protein [Opitutaceae bacterium]
MNEVYRWNPAEGIVGVVGVAPAATADFYLRLTALTPARKDWEHVRVLIDSNPKLPSRGRHLELGETDPSPFIRACIDDLMGRGACVVAVPCNTAHILYERFAEGLSDVVPNMIDAAVEALVDERGSAPRRLAVLGSRLTVAHDLYGRRVRLLGGGCIDMNAWQPEISALIEQVKQGGDLKAGAQRLQRVVAGCCSADAVVIACTELSSLLSGVEFEVPMIDASTALARRCLAIASRNPEPSTLG